MLTTGTMAAGMPGMTHDHSTMAAGAGAGAHAGHHKADPKLPNAHDPRFMDLTVGTAAQAKEMGRYRQAGGAGYGGREGEDVNNQKDKNEIIDKTDANHLPQYGVLPGQNYVQAIQTYTGLSAIKDLSGMQGFPLTEDDWSTIVALQDQGGSPVLAVVNYLTGLTNDLPPDLPQSIAAKRDAVANFQLPGAGGETIHDIAINPKDRSGNNIARSHHSADWFGMYRKLAESGVPQDWAFQLAFSDDGTSGSGRFNGFNNQDGNETGANDGENAYFKMIAVASQQLGRPDLFNVLLTGGHNHTALDPSVMTEPKINKLIGWNPPGDATMSPERVEAIRQYYLRADVAVDEGDFKRHLKTLPPGLASQLDFAGVQFEAEENNNNGGGNGGGNGGNEDTGPLTGAGTGAITGGGPAQLTPIGSGQTITPDLPGSPTIDTRPTLELLGQGGPFPVIDPKTGRLDKALQDQLMTAFIETIMSMNDSPFLEEPEERAAFNDGARKGVQFLKDAIAVDPTAVSDLKAELATALADGTITDAERASLAEKLNEAGMADAAAAVEDGSATEAEIATLQEKVDGAASAKLEKDITAAMEDGTLTPEERATIESRLGKEGLDALEKGIEDGTVTKEELEAISAGTRNDEAARQAAKPEGATDAEAGAQATADGAPPAGKAEAGADQAGEGAGAVQGDSGPPAKGDKPAGDTPAAEGQGSEQPSGDAPAGDAPAGNAGGDGGGNGGGGNGAGNGGGGEGSSEGPPPAGDAPAGGSDGAPPAAGESGGGGGGGGGAEEPAAA